MILTEASIKTFKQQLQESELVCSERCLYQAADWSAELLDGINTEFMDNNDRTYTQNDDTLPYTSISHTNYESSLEPLTELEFIKYERAKTLFSLRQYDSVLSELGGFEKPKLVFLRLYAQYLAGEKRQQERIHEMPLESEYRAVVNKELDPLYNELMRRYDENQLDAFGLYLFGVILRKCNKLQNAAAALKQSLLQYQFNWSAWMEFGALIRTKEQFKQCEGFLNKANKLNNSIMKELFFAKVSLKIYEHPDPNPYFRNAMNPINDYFANSTYVLSQWANYHYNNKEYNASAAYFEELRQRSPKQLDDMDTYSNLLYIQESKVKLCVLAMECKEIDKFRPETWFVCANYHGAIGEIGEAVNYFKKAILLDRNYQQAWTLLGHDYIELLNPRAAIGCYRKATDIDSRDYRAWHSLGQAYELMGAPSLAIEYYEKAKNIQPYSPLLWRSLQRCYTALNRHREARNCGIKAAECDE